MELARWISTFVYHQLLLLLRNNLIMLNLTSLSVHSDKVICMKHRQTHNNLNFNGSSHSIHFSSFNNHLSTELFQKAISRNQIFFPFIQSNEFCKVCMVGGKTGNFYAWHMIHLPYCEWCFTLNCRFSLCWRLMNQSKFEIMKKGLCDRPVISRMFDGP
jgi:hypothetical protein